MLNALDPFSYDYAGLSTSYSTDQDMGWYKYLGRCWTAANMSDWMPEGFPENVRSRLRCHSHVCPWVSVCVCAVLLTASFFMPCTVHPFRRLQPKNNTHMCCAMFLVTRERILARPRGLYEAWYNFLNTTVRGRTILFHFTWKCARSLCTLHPLSWCWCV